jgi:hypothetical protein
VVPVSTEHYRRILELSGTRPPRAAKAADRTAGGATRAVPRGAKRAKR